jgi:hypothetical protein
MLRNFKGDEPQQIGKILPGVLLSIKDRCNRYRREHGLPTIDEELEYNRKARILSAVGDFVQSKKPSRNKKKTHPKRGDGTLTGHEKRVPGKYPSLRNSTPDTEGNL